MNHGRPSQEDIERTIGDLISNRLSIPREQVRPSTRLFEDLPEGVDWLELAIAIEDAFPDHSFDLERAGDDPFHRPSVTLRDVAEWLRRGWS